MSRFTLLPYAKELGWFYVRDSHDPDNRCVGAIYDGTHFRPAEDSPPFGSSDLREIADLLDSLQKPLDGP